MKQENGTNNPYGVKAGEIWVEVDPRNEWIIEVISVDEEAGIAKIKHTESGRTTRARLNRFHGKRGGYTRKVEKKMNYSQLCCAYCFFVLGQEEQESYIGEKIDIYIADGTRRWLHDELCNALGLTRNETREVMDNLSKYKFNPHRVYEALCGIKEKKRK